MYSTENEAESVIPEKFIRILKIRTNRCLTGIGKYIYVLKTHRMR